jgi:spore maturation protein SpmB
VEFALSRGEILGLRLSMTGSEGLAMKKNRNGAHNSFHATISANHDNSSEKS